MPNPLKETNPNPKPSKGAYLAEISIKEIKELLDHYKNEQRIELIEHLMGVFNDVYGYFKTKDEDILDNFRRQHAALLERYGKAFKPYNDKYFHKLYNFSTLLLEKGYYTAEEFANLKNQEGELLQEDVTQWIARTLKYLHIDRYYSLMEQDPEFETPKNPELSGIKEEKDDEVTEARQLLAIYYLLKVGFGITHRETNEVSDVARLAHLFLGKKFTKLQNSNIYDKLKLMPYYHKKEELLKDLRYIRPYFEKLSVKTVLDLIDLEIERTIKEPKD